MSPTSRLNLFRWLRLSPASPAIRPTKAYSRLHVESLEAREVLNADLFPLTSIPRLESLPSARATIYLDFDGHFQDSYHGEEKILGIHVSKKYRNVSSPAFSLDNDRTTFSSRELNAIHEIWARVAEDFAPFHINVTTVDPGNFSPGKALRVAIGGSSQQVLGTNVGGSSFLNSFSNSAPNIVYAFDRGTDAKGEFAISVRYIAVTVSHEVGHALGLHHQVLVRHGVVVEHYRQGDAKLSPIMGSPYDRATTHLSPSQWQFSERNTWSNGPYTVLRLVLPVGVPQDDMAIIASNKNGFGYRPDDHGNTIDTATRVSPLGGFLNVQGILEKTSDLDMFRFEHGGGTIDLHVFVARFGDQVIANLDARLEVYDAGGGLIASNRNVGLDASLRVHLLPGVYYVGVRSQGNYGEVGQYTLKGAGITPVTLPHALTIPRVIKSSFANGGRELHLTFSTRMASSTLNPNHVRLFFDQAGSRQVTSVQQLTSDGTVFRVLLPALNGQRFTLALRSGQIMDAFGRRMLNSFVITSEGRDVVTGLDGHRYVFTSAKQLVRFNGTEFVKVTSTNLLAMEHGPQGYLYLLNFSNQLSRYDGKRFLPLATGIRSLTKGADGNLYLVNSANRLLRYDGNRLTTVIANIRSLERGRDGNLYVLTTANRFARLTGNFLVYLGTATFSKLEKGPGEDLYLLNTKRQLLRYDGRRFTTVSAPDIRSLERGRDGHLYVLNTANRLVRYDGTRWTVISQIRLSQLWKDKHDHLFVRTTAGPVYRLDGVRLVRIS